jgi:hypothetical protein
MGALWAAESRPQDVELPREWFVEPRPASRFVPTREATTLAVRFAATPSTDLANQLMEARWGVGLHMNRCWDVNGYDVSIWGCNGPYADAFLWTDPEFVRLWDFIVQSNWQ